MLSYFLVFIITIVTVYLVNPLACKLGFLDIPTARKQHLGAVPVTGGVAIFLGVFSVSVLLNGIQLGPSPFFWMALGILLVIGVIVSR